MPFDKCTFDYPETILSYNHFKEKVASKISCLSRKGLLLRISCLSKDFEDLFLTRWKKFELCLVYWACKAHRTWVNTNSALY